MRIRLQQLVDMPARSTDPQSNAISPLAMIPLPPLNEHLEFIKRIVLD